MWLVSHDRELLAACAQRIVTVGENRRVWVHGSRFSGYAQARADRISRLEELRRRWNKEHQKLKELVRTYRQKASYNSESRSRLQAAVTRLRRFKKKARQQEHAGTEREIVGLRGGRTGKRAVICENLVLTGDPSSFGTEIYDFDEQGGDLRRRRLGEVELPAAARGGAGATRGAVAAQHGWCQASRRLHARPDLAGRAPVRF